MKKKRKKLYHNTPALGLDFTNSGVLVFDRQLDSMKEKHSLLHNTMRMKRVIEREKKRGESVCMKSFRERERESVASRENKRLFFFLFWF